MKEIWVHLPQNLHLAVQALALLERWAAQARCGVLMAVGSVQLGCSKHTECYTCKTESEIVTLIAEPLPNFEENFSVWGQEGRRHKRPRSIFGNDLKYVFRQHAVPVLNTTHCVCV